MPKEEQLVSLNTDQLKEFVATLVTELKKPDAETQRKLDEERANKIRLAAEQANLAKAKHDNERAVQQVCQHLDFNGQKHTFYGRVCSNGDAMARCSQCNIDVRWKATPQELSEGRVFLSENPHIRLDYLLKMETAYPPKVVADRIKNTPKG